MRTGMVRVNENIDVSIMHLIGIEINPKDGKLYVYASDCLVPIVADCGREDMLKRIDEAWNTK